jgi:sigma-54 specific flagellar transcriptional regulator A
VLGRGSKYMEIVGDSEAIQAVKALIQQVAKTQASVLIYGESGTGKELIAKNIHEASLRSKEPFIAINCGAIPAELLESELFGHEKGSFTGAMATRQGRFELAHKGTIFLDEIGDMPLIMQVKLLRILQEQSFERVGGSKTIQTDVRIIAATNQNLEQQLANGKFREDLFYRLNVFPISVPSLRERSVDVPILINFVLSKLQTQMPICNFSDAAMKELQDYYWPGNIRELTNIVERLCIMHPQQIVDKEQLPEQIPSLQPLEHSLHNFDQILMSKTDMLHNNFDLKRHIANIEISLINAALSKANNIVSHAAHLLGIRRTTLIEKMKKYQVVKSYNARGTNSD